MGLKLFLNLELTSMTKLVIFLCLLAIRIFEVFGITYTRAKLHVTQFSLLIVITVAVNVATLAYKTLKCSGLE